jgi:hypothetical protein
VVQVLLLPATAAGARSGTTSGTSTSGRQPGGSGTTRAVVLGAGSRRRAANSSMHAWCAVVLHIIVV